MKVSDPPTTVHDYGARLAQLFRLSIPHVPEHIIKRAAHGDTKGELSRKRRKVDFIESDLQTYLQEGCFRSAGLPLCVVNKNHGKSGKIDYQFRSGTTTHIRTVATCELKGPPRKKFLKDPNNNWLWAIVEDVAKQFYRCHTNALADAEHYVVVLTYGTKSSVAQGFQSMCIKPLKIIFPTARFEVISEQTTVLGQPLTVFVVGVKTTSEYRCD